MEMGTCRDNGDTHSLFSTRMSAILAEISVSSTETKQTEAAATTKPILSSQSVSVCVLGIETISVESAPNLLRSVGKYLRTRTTHHAHG